jgi:hypothetical protein
MPPDADSRRRRRQDVCAWQAYPFDGDFVNDIQRSKQAHSAASAAIAQRHNIYTPVQLGCLPINRNRLYLDGDVRYANMQNMFYNMGEEMKFAFEDFQISVLNQLCLMCVDVIYEQEFRRNPKQILDKHKLSKIEIGTLIVAERRIGKTIMTAAFALALALFVPGIRIAVFSIGGRATGGLKEWVGKFIQNMPRAQRRLVVNNSERMSFALNELPSGITTQHPEARAAAQRADTSTILFLPGAGNGKGENLDLFCFLAPFFAITTISVMPTRVQHLSSLIQKISKTKTTRNQHHKAKRN